MPEVGEPRTRDTSDSVAQRIAAAEAALRSSEHQVATWVAQHPVESASMSADRLATAVGVSDASVVRTARALGYEGFSDLKRALRRDLSDALDAGLRLDQRAALLRADAGSYFSEVAVAAHRLIDEALARLGIEEMTRIAEIVRGASATHIYGIGPSGTIAEYLALRLGRIGVRTFATNRTGFALADHLQRLRSGDAIILIAPGRLHHEMEVLLHEANDLRIPVIAVTDTLRPLLVERVAEVLWAPFASSGIPGETFVTSLLADLITDAVAAADATAADAAYRDLRTRRSAIARSQQPRSG